MGTLETAGLLVLAFGISSAAGFLLTARRRSRLRVLPEVGATLRIRSVSGMYRSKLIAVAPEVWTLSAPLSRNHYVPLRVDDAVTVEAPVRGGVYLFKTVICGRSQDEHEVQIRPPSNLAPRNRREVKRYDRHVPAQIDGQPAFLVDVSSLGAKLKSRTRFRPGERVRLDLEEGMVFGWVLECWPTRHGDPWKEIVRVRFESTFEPILP